MGVVGDWCIACRAALALTLLGLSLARSSTLFAEDGGPEMLNDAPTLTRKIGAKDAIIVDIEGKGNFKSVQAAIDSVPDGNNKWVVIHILICMEYWGVFGSEKVQIPESKPFIFMRGNGLGKSFIQWSQSSKNNIDSATFKVEASNFIAFGISFKNEAPTGMAQTSQNQSVAAFVGADRVAFYHCGFFSTHNTLFDYKGRHYYEECYIQGSIDFIFGRAKSLFKACELFVVGDRRTTIHGSITAQSRESATEDSGFSFVNTTVYGTDDVYLGRAKNQFSRVIFALTYLSNTITPQGWTNWSYKGNTKNLYHAEYMCSGPGSGTANRAGWSKSLSRDDAAPFLDVSFINGTHWLPSWL
ncbi:hypothetical protein V2J09_006362 [Rumex salicifolius]